MGANRPFSFVGRRVFPPEPPVAITIPPERRGGVKGAPVVGAAQRTLDVEHRSGIHSSFDGRLGGNTFPLVGSECWLWTAGPRTAQQHTRRLITLIFAGRNRMVMIRRELPRTEYAGWVWKPCRTEDKEDSPIRGLCAVPGSAVQCRIAADYAAVASFCCCSVFTPMAQMKPSSSRPRATIIWFLFLPRAAMLL